MTTPSIDADGFRVLPGRDGRGDERLLLDVESADPVYVPRTALPDDVAVGNRVSATVGWTDDDPTVDDVVVAETTTFAFVRTDEPVFQAAQACFEEARASGAAMNSRVTYSTDNEANGVVYTFADQPGSRDLFDEFRDGLKPLEPLLARTADADGVEPPFSVYVLEPPEPFTVVYIVLEPGGLLDETVRETYC